MPDLVDLRSDTVTSPHPPCATRWPRPRWGTTTTGRTRPSAALEEAFAERVDKPAALFVPSGVMANQIAVRVLAPPGTAVLVGRRQHLVAYEFGAAALNAGVEL